MIDLRFKYKELISFLEKESPFSPEFGLILGSGLGDFADNINTEKSISTTSIPGYPASTIVGHAGKIHFATFAGKKLLIFQGRIHFYEGYTISESILPAFISEIMGCKSLLITNAAGGVHPDFVPGDLMLINSFNSIAIKKELSGFFGLASEKGKLNFSDFPSARLNNVIESAALEEKINLKKGTYWYSKGPSYETPAEIRMIKKLGGDAVGMSTVLEATYSAYKGIETSAISCITNLAAGISPTKLEHAEVTETANKVKTTFERLLKKTIELI
ncbi:MAG: purine-nucleoside phosphorylase [Ignavibacteriales bacterium]|nr:MAG: purine-nucleoside phosphorylase [Ignavibacteriales bacterium]